MGIKILVATNKNHLFGLYDKVSNRHGLPWKILNNVSERIKKIARLDMRIFRKLTHPKNIKTILIMGRITYESIPNKEPLEGRTNVVITSQAGQGDFIDTEVTKFFESLSDALDEYPDAFLIGGVSLVKEMLSEYPDLIESIQINLLDFALDLIPDDFEVTEFPLDDIMEMIEENTNFDPEDCIFTID